MPAIRIGIHLRSLGQPFKKALLTANQLGADAVEIDARSDIKPQDLSRTATRQLRKMLDDLNLRVSAVRFQTRRGYNVLEDLEARLEATRQAMQMAWSLGASVVVNQVGRIPRETDDPQWELLIQTLSELGEYGHKVGARLAARTGAEPGEDLARLVEALPPGAIGVDLDPGELVVRGFSVREAVESLAPYVVHVHARDAVRDLAANRGLETPLGRGAVDFPAILGALDERQYRGYFTIERTSSPEAASEIGQAVQYLRAL